jgi:uncharacterized protein YmfQ (DUF2313 family)
MTTEYVVYCVDVDGVEKNIFKIQDDTGSVGENFFSPLAIPRGWCVAIIDEENLRLHVGDAFEELRWQWRWCLVKTTRKAFRDATWHLSDKKNMSNRKWKQNMLRGTSKSLFMSESARILWLSWSIRA